MNKKGLCSEKGNLNNCLCCRGICDCEYGCSHNHEELCSEEEK